MMQSTAMSKFLTPDIVVESKKKFLNKRVVSPCEVNYSIN